MAPFHKKNEIIRYIAVDRLEFSQENSIITVFSPLFADKKNLSSPFPVT